MKVFDPSFWRALIGPLARTAISAITPFLAIILAAPFALETWKMVGPIVLLAVIIAIGNALKGLPDTTGTWWEIALQRSARQAGQIFVAMIIPGVAFGDLNWQTILVNTAISFVATFILAAMSIVSPDAVPGGRYEYTEEAPLPETPLPEDPAEPMLTGSEEDTLPLGDPAIEDGGDPEIGIAADAAPERVG
jgi:hypothetical protein